MVAGKEVSPKDVQATERLHHYWRHGEGALKIQWGVPGDFKRCVLELGKYISNPEGYCAKMHHDVTGGWPGHAPGIEEAEAAAKNAASKSNKGGSGKGRGKGKN